MNREDIIKDIARGAGKIVLDKYKCKHTWHTKESPGDIVTEVDGLSEKYIIENILSHFPEDKIISEECGSAGSISGRYKWIIDPIDGTRNYMTKIPFFCVSIALLDDDNLELGVIYDPVHDEMFFAKNGGGAFLNDEAISVSSDQTMEDSLISVSWVKSRVDGARFLDYIADLSHETSYFRRFGSAALVMAYVACGKLHGYIQAGLKPWDIAAGVLIVKEAGGITSDFKGCPINFEDTDIEIIAGGPFVHNVLLEMALKK